MGKLKGFMESRRQVPTRRHYKQRLRDWDELSEDLSPERLQQQGGRCMDCGVPFCQQGCPLGNQIPDWNDLVHRENWREAYERLAATNNFPEITGRICPAPCEAACVLAINDDPVTIEQLEKAIAERAFEEGWVLPSPPAERTGKHVAVVGSGPAGLAAAAQLCSAGHEVTVYEAADRIGGLLRYGIPDFKLEKWVLDRRLEILREEGIELVTGARVGDDPTWEELHRSADALLVAIGSGRARDLQVPGRGLDGVGFAMPYLEEQNRGGGGDEIGEAQISAAGKDVVILGGGDTGADCLGTALRQGARSVRQIELLPRPPGQRSQDNPWPQWPLTDRFSPSHEEGGDRDFGVLTKHLEGRGGDLTTLHAVRVDVERDAQGRFEVQEIPGSGFRLHVDLLILALGFLGPEARSLVDQLGVSLDARGNVAIDDKFATSVDGVFCAGDAQRGQSLVVWAISDGREAARAIDSYLRGGAASWLPTRGRDAHFGGR